MWVSRLKRKGVVLLDRDGTVIVERNYLSDPDRVELLPGSAAGLRQMASMGLGLVLITNQSGIGRGFFDETRVREIHQRLQEFLAVEGIELDGIYFCPHKPTDNCDCRKPRTGMVEKAKTCLGFDPQKSFVIGDKPCDVELGKAVGATTFLVRTGYGSKVATEGSTNPDYIVDNLVEAAEVIQKIIGLDVGMKNSLNYAVKS